MSWEQLLFILAVLTTSAVIKNWVGIGAGIFLVPVLAMVLPPKLALGIGAPAMLISDLVGVRNYWGEWDGEELKRLLPTGIIGVVCGVFLIDYIPSRHFQIGIGVLAVCFSISQLLKPFF